MAVRVQPVSTRDIGPRSAWYGDDGIEYVGDDVIFAEAIEAVRSELIGALQVRINALNAADVSVPDLMDEIRDQMVRASAHAQFGDVRELHDMALGLLLAESSAKRAV
jgi:hypothetical protein